jgi:adenylate cyclase
MIDANRARLAPEGSRREVTVMCLAAGGVSVESPAADPGEVVRRLRTHRAAVREAILGLGGMLAGTGGGRITAFFGAPVESEDHARRACLSSLRVRALERELNGTTPSVFVSRIGIHSGVCIAGFLGARGLPDYSLVGPPADLAARLEGLNGSIGTSIIVSERVRETAGPGFLVRMLGMIPGDGRGGRVRVYELLAEKGEADAPPDLLIAEFEEGLARYEGGDFAGALVMFSQVLARAPGDGPSAAYALRCRQLVANPGAADVTFFPL